jgi:hypothetical protein
MTIAILIVGAVLALLGAAGIRLAATTPIQLQPLPAIAFLVGASMMIFALGGLVL